MHPNDSAARQPRTKKGKKKKLCPFLSSPFEDCYALDMDSTKIAMVVHYCQNHFEECDIYKRMSQQK